MTVTAAACWLANTAAAKTQNTHQNLNFGLHLLWLIARQTRFWKILRKTLISHTFFFAMDRISIHLWLNLTISGSLVIFVVDTYRRTVLDTWDTLNRRACGGVCARAFVVAGFCCLSRGHRAFASRLPGPLVGSAAGSLASSQAVASLAPLVRYSPPLKDYCSPLRS